MGRGYGFAIRLAAGPMASPYVPAFSWGSAPNLAGASPRTPPNEPAPLESYFGLDGFREFDGY